MIFLPRYNAKIEHQPIIYGKPTTIYEIASRASLAEAKEIGNVHDAMEKVEAIAVPVVGQVYVIVPSVKEADCVCRE